MSDESKAPATANKDLLDGLSKFEASALKHVEKVPEKVVLPSQEGTALLFYCIIKKFNSTHHFAFLLSSCIDIDSEKKHISLVTSVISFEQQGLHKVETQEKVVLPSKEGTQICYFRN